MPMHPLLAMLTQRTRTDLGIRESEIDRQDLSLQVHFDGARRITDYRYPELLFDQWEVPAVFMNGLNRIGEPAFVRSMRCRMRFHVSAEGKRSFAIDGFTIDNAALLSVIGEEVFPLLERTLRNLQHTCLTLPDAREFTQRVRDGYLARRARACEHGMTDFSAAHWMAFPVVAVGYSSSPELAELIDLAVEFEVSPRYEIERVVYGHGNLFLIPIVIPTALEDRHGVVVERVYERIVDHLLPPILGELDTDATISR